MPLPLTLAMSSSSELGVEGDEEEEDEEDDDESDESDESDSLTSDSARASESG